MTSFDELFVWVTDAAQRGLESPQERTAAAAKVLALHSCHRQRFKSRWDLAKLAFSTTRRSLAQAERVPNKCLDGLTSLLAVALHVCPETALSSLSVVVKVKQADALSTQAATRLAAALAADSEGALVALSLLELWQHLEQRGECSWSFYHALCNVVWVATCRLQRAVGDHTTHVAVWLGNLFEYAVRHPQHVGDVLQMLSESRDRHALLTAAARHHVALRQQWCSVRQRVVACGHAALAAYCAVVERTWSCLVKPILVRAFSCEPSPFSETFFAPPLLTTEDVEKLMHEALPTLSTAAHGGQTDRVFTMLTRAHAVERTLFLVSPVGATDANQTALTPLITFALRTGRIDCAVDLLQWGSHWERTSDGSDAAPDRESAWQQRLEAVNRTTPRNAAANVRWHRNAAAATWDQVVSEASPRLDAKAALDLLVTSDDLDDLRLVLDACLLPSRAAPLPWPRTVLSDPFASVFICKALGQVIHILLNRGEAALARLYLTRLSLCTLACPTHEALFLLLQALARMARVLTVDADLAAHPHGGSAAHQRWDAIHHALTPLLRQRPSLGAISWNDFDPKGCLPTGSSLLPSATLLSVALDGEDVVLERRWSSAGPTTVAAVLRLSHKRCSMEHLLVQVQAVTQANRQQLLEGTSGGAAAERVRSDSVAIEPDAVALVTGTPSSCIPPTATEKLTDRHAAKQAWWAKRFALDADMFRVVAQLECLVGLAGTALFAGEPAPDVRQQLWELAGTLVATTARDELYTDTQAILTVGGRFHALCYGALQALPYLLHTATEPLAAGGDTPDALRVGYKYAPPVWACAKAFPREGVAAEDREGCGHPGCLCHPGAWHTVTQRLAATLDELLAMALAEIDEDAQRQGDVEPTHTPATHMTVPHAASKPLADVLEEVARSTLKTFFEKATEARDFTTSDTRVDLTRLPRQHVYLALGPKLHGLPWESVRPLRQGSSSRLLTACTGAMAVGCCGSPRCSLSRCHVVLDTDAVSSRDVMERLAEERSGSWTIECVDTGADSRNTSAATASNTSHRSEGPGTPLRQQPQALLQRLITGRYSCYVYMGHRRGECVLSARQLYNRLPTATTKLPSLVLLMGCSSARVVDGALHRGFGMPCAYAHAGVEAFLGCLWDITDGDIDKLTQRFLTLALAATESATVPLTVGEALAAARGACRLPCLSAAATVFYGVNATFER